MESWVVWVGRELKVHLMDRDTFHQTRTSRDGAAPACQGKKKGGKKEKAEQEGRAATRDAVPSAGSGTDAAGWEQEPGGDVTVPRIPELLRLEKLSEVIKSEH